MHLTVFVPAKAGFTTEEALLFAEQCLRQKALDHAVRVFDQTVHLTPAGMTLTGEAREL